MKQEDVIVCSFRHSNDDEKLMNGIIGACEEWVVWFLFILLIGSSKKTKTKLDTDTEFILSELDNVQL